MKYMNLFRFAAAPLAGLLLCSCASTPGGAHARFHDQSACDAIVRFSSWDLITINKPETRENGFLPLYRLPDAEGVLARPDYPHGLAAVVCGAFLSVSQEAELQRKWAAIFASFGYNRVVFLRAGSQNQVNGLAVIRDLPLAAAQYTAVSRPSQDQETR
jgi:hypothetical protein